MIVTLPIAVEVHEGAGYIRYRDEKVAQTVDLMETGSVAADITADAKVIGIEILDIASAEQIDIAQRFAHDRGLGFPRDLSGVIVDESSSAHL